jgi:hypothetical protein
MLLATQRASRRITSSSSRVATSRAGKLASQRRYGSPVLVGDAHVGIESRAEARVEWRT